jgi:predicted Zn-dependent peptidase
MPSYTRTVLPNSLRLILAPQKDSVATTILVLVEAGSKYETKDINGLSHFLEHMCFKGTTKRPTAMHIAGELDGIGAEYNAFTSQEWTGYFVKVQAHKSEQAIDIISDLYLNPVFDPAEIEKEKGVIIEEINMYEDLPPRRVQEIFTQLVYGDQPAGWDIGGRKEVIRAMTRDHFTKYRGEHYVAQATAIVVAGAFDEKKVQKQIEEQFKNLSTEKKFGKVATTESQSEPQIKVQFKESDQTHLVIGCRAFNAFDKRRYAIEVMGDILGGGMSSRLFQKVREELGAAYYIKAGADLFSDHGFFAVSSGVEHSKLKIVIQAILEELQKVAKQPITPAELTRAKEHLSGGLLLGLETSDALANYFGGQEIMKQDLISPEDLLKKIHAVTAEEVQSIAREIFKNEKLNMALIGPQKLPDELRGLLRFL